MRSCNFFSFAPSQAKFTLALLLSASLALFLPAAASASNFPPSCCNPAEYNQSITFQNFQFAPAGGTGTITTATSLGPLSDSLGLGASASTTNMYNIPSLSAQVTAGNAITNVIDNLTYNIMFAGTGSGTTSVTVTASTTLTGSPGAGTVSESIVGTGFSVSGGTSESVSLLVAINQIYTVTMLINLFPEFGGTASASADPTFTGIAAGITLETSAGIGNNSPVGTTPIPAALPLFATGIGGLGLLGWRRKRKALAAGS